MRQHPATMVDETVRRNGSTKRFDETVRQHPAHCLFDETVRRDGETKLLNETVIRNLFDEKLSRDGCCAAPCTIDGAISSKCHVSLYRLRGRRTKGSRNQATKVYVFIYIYMEFTLYIFIHPLFVSSLFIYSLYAYLFVTQSIPP